MSFDRTKLNVILLSDVTETASLTKSFGVYKVAHELRLVGYEVFVLHHLHIFTPDEIVDILGQLVSDKTLFIGCNPMFYRQIISFDYSNSDPKDGDMKLADLDTQQRMIGCLIPHGREYNKKIKDTVHAINPNCKFVIGGPLAFDNVFNKEFDYVIKGYADVSITNLADHLCRSTPLSKAHKSIYGFTIIDDAKAESFDFSHSTMKFVETDCIRPEEVLPIEISRGCIFKCSFCSYPLNGKKKLDYIKSMEILYQELVNNYEQFGVTSYYFLDDTFNDSVDKIKLIYEISKRLPFKLRYWAYLRLDLMISHPETMTMIYDSGCRGTHFGIETLNKETGSIIGKGMARERILRGLETVKKTWPEAVIYGSFIAGLPKESKQSLMETIDWMNKENCPLDGRNMFPLNIYKDNVGFVSDIDANPEKFGYRDLTLVPGKTQGYRWTNDYMTYEEAVEISKLCQPVNNSLSSHAIFSLMSLGLDIEYVRVPKLQLDWHAIIRQKWLIAKDYKQKVFDICSG